jgi:hypothetical protein
MAHERLDREQRVEASSDRAFGWVFAAVFLVVAAWPLLYAAPPRWWSAAIAALFGLLAAFRPASLSTANRLWLKFGLLLGKVVSPIALGILYYAVLVPIGLAMRLAGKDPLRQKRDGDADSYWLRRQPPGPPPDSMNRQF